MTYEHLRYLWADVTPLSPETNAGNVPSIFDYARHLYFPQSIQKRLVKNFTVWGLITRPTPAECEEKMKELRLLNEKNMKELFPEAQIIYEKFMGMNKSLIAVYKTCR